jgi:hypothetical protein
VRSEPPSSEQPKITNFVDTLYFTVTTFSTTGFGDITLVGTHGRLLSVAMMFVGISLFLRLAQAVFRPGEGAPPVPALRPTAARRRRRALQGVRPDRQHPERRGLTPVAELARRQLCNAVLHNLRSRGIAAEHRVSAPTA